MTKEQLKVFNVLYKYVHVSCSKATIMSGNNTPSEAITLDEKAIFDSYDTD